MARFSQGYALVIGVGADLPGTTRRSAQGLGKSRCGQADPARG